MKPTALDRMTARILTTNPARGLSFSRWIVTPLLANIVFPEFFGPYAVGIFAPWIVVAALCCELLVFWAFQLRVAVWWLIVIAFLTANAVSTVIGWFLFGFVIPDVKFGRAGWLIAFIPAYLVSVVIEYAVYRAFARWRMLSRPFVASLVSNAASYFVIAFCVWRGWAF
jgi:hypothetical protein